MINHITMSGDCSLRAIADHHATLQDAFRGGEGGIAVDMAAVEDVDVSFIQLMLSAAKTAAASDRAFSLLNMPAPVAACFANAGVDVTRFASRA